MSEVPSGFTALTYNIHRCHGTDGHYDPYRVAQILREVDADVMGLQEVDTGLMVPLCDRRHAHVTAVGERPGPLHLMPGDPRCGEQHQLDFLRDQTGCQAVEGLMLRRGSRYGNALLTRHEIGDVRRVDLTVRGGSERRGALDVQVIIRGRPVRIVVVHLGVPIWERYFQVARLLKAIGHDRTDQMVMMGDFNLFVSVLPKLRRFYRRLGHAPLVRTFPSYFPLLPLDRVWSQPASCLKTLERYDTPLARAASDHLPLLATLSFKA